MVALAVGMGDNAKQKASPDYLCHDHMEAFSNPVFA